MATSPREALRETVRYQDLGKGLGPRLAKVLAKAVDDLLDRMVRYVERYADEIGETPAGASRWLSSVWGPFDRAWLADLADSLPEPVRGRWLAEIEAPWFDMNVSRRKAIAYASRMTAERLEHDALEVAGPPLGRVAQEASAQTAFQVAKTAGVAFSFSMPNEGQIERVLNSAGISKQIKGFSRTAVKAVEDEVVRGMMAGSGIEDIARTIRRNTPVESMVRARRIARTMSTDCAAEAKLREYKEIGVEEYRILCTLDERTCATCGALDGKTFPVAGAHPRPSFHPNCRCIVEEVLPPELVQDLTRSARDEDGKTIQVPQSMTYDEWRKRFMKPTKPAARRSAGSASRARASPRYFEEPDRRKVAVGRPNIPRVEPFAPSMPTSPSQATAPATSPEEVKPLEEMMRPARVAGAERGEPMGFDKADRGEANPHEGERMNCQSCVVANEMRRRGYDVQARVFDPSSPSQAMLSRIPQAAWKDPSTGRVPIPERYPGRTRDSFEQWLDEMIGEGQRYTFFVTWTTSGTGHVVCADRGPRGVRVLDPQTGKVYEGAALTAKYTDRIFMDGTFAPRLLRVDNKVPNLEIVDYALEKKEARDGS